MRFTNQRQWVNRLRTIKANLAYQGSKYAKSSFLALPYKEPSYLTLWKGKNIPKGQHQKEKVTFVQCELLPAPAARHEL